MRARKKLESFIHEVISNQQLQAKLEAKLVDPNELTPDSGNALNEAAKCLSVTQHERITLLLKHGANINQQQHKGDRNTALHTFVANELFDCVQHIIAEAARFGQKINFTLRDFEGKNTLILAIKIHHEAMALHILEHALKQNEFNVNDADQDGMTALHYACALGMPRLAAELLRCGASMTKKNKKDRAPIDCTALDEAEIHSMLRSASVDADRDEMAARNNIIDCYNQDIITFRDDRMMPIPGIPAVVASRHTLEQVVKLPLLDSAALYRIGSKEIQVQQPLQYLLAHPLDEASKLAILKQCECFTGTSVLKVILRERLNAQAVLIENGANYAWLLRSYAANNNQQLHVLLQRDDIGQYINAKGVPSLKTALHFAAAKNNDVLCETLVAHGAVLNEQDKDGNTPLHLACLAGHEKAVLWLVQHGADVAIKNNQGNTVFVILANKGLHALAQAITGMANKGEEKVQESPIFGK